MGEKVPATGDEQITAEAAGRLAGRLMSRVGVRLLRMPPIRRAVRRGVQEARAEEAGQADQPESPAD